MQTKDKVEKLRADMKAPGLFAYIQPVHDEYQSEYPPACNRRVEWLSGFSGSAGSVVVTVDAAAMFVDGRYVLQVKHETDTALFSYHNSGDLTPEAWLAQQAPIGAKIGYDAALYTLERAQRMEAVLAKAGLQLTPIDNLVDAIWKDRPPVPQTPLFVHGESFSGESAVSKRARMAAAIAKAGADAALIAAPESVNWLLNIRGHDVTHTPLALGFALLEADASVRLYIDPSRADSTVMAHMGNQVSLHVPGQLPADLVGLGAAKKRVLIDPAGAAFAQAEILENAGAILILAADPCVLAKACKNAVELENIRDTHIRDGVAVASLLCWLEQQATVDELAVAEKLLSLRRAVDGFVEPSFDTIAGSGAHGAIVHYRANEKSNRQLQKGELFLLDSGGQYPGGTTDITRTVAIGMPSAEQRDRFTRVLKGHIALATAQFPEGTSGSQLDALARRYLWEVGLDYDHGTGHGVGCFLGVHEGPQRISKRGGDAPLKPGMIVSNEPGYYKAGEYGIRIENLVAVVSKTPGEGGRIMLGFDTLTCVPIDTRLVEVSMLTPPEKSWLNDYHAWVEKQLAPRMEAAQRAWLSERCRAI